MCFVVKYLTSTVGLSSMSSLLLVFDGLNEMRKSVKLNLRAPDCGVVAGVVKRLS